MWFSGSSTNLLAVSCGGRPWNEASDTGTEKREVGRDGSSSSSGVLLVVVAMLRPGYLLLSSSSRHQKSHYRFKVWVPAAPFVKFEAIAEAGKVLLWLCVDRNSHDLLLKRELSLADQPGSERRLTQDFEVVAQSVAEEMCLTSTLGTY